MNKAIFSIKPEYIDMIFSGLKKYEYRKQICKKRITKMLFYSTAPVKMIVGEADVIDVITQRKSDLWNKTKDNSGVSKDFYDRYFDGYEYATAYLLGNIVRYEKPKPLIDYGIKLAPQSFCYISE